MQQSRISILLKNSRSRHQIIKNPYLKRASIQHLHTIKLQKQTQREYKKIISQVKYYESLNRRLLSKVQKQKIMLISASQNRKRIQDDIIRKKYLQDIRNNELIQNKKIAQKIRNQRSDRQDAVRLSKMQKSYKGSIARNTKTRLKSQQYQNQLKRYQNNKNKVQSILQFQCSLKQSYIRQKQHNNQKHLKNYKQSILNKKKYIKFKKQQSQTAKQRLKILTSGTSQFLNELYQISKSIYDYRTSRKVSLSPLSFNKQKLRSRCYTHAHKQSLNNVSTDNSLFFSHQKSQN